MILIEIRFNPNSSYRPKDQHNVWFTLPSLKMKDLPLGQS